VVLADILEAELERTVEEFRRRELAADMYVVDLMKVASVNEMIDTVVQRHGTIHILVNNAGIQIRKKAVDFTEEDWDRLMGINLKSYYFASTAAAKVMIKRGNGAIVCISSENSAHYTSKRSLYGVSKGGVNAMVGALGVEWARYGIRINAVAPGFIDTKMHRTAVQEGVLDDAELLSVLPNKRLLLAEEIADAVCFLASDGASGIVGQTLFVDGGANKNCLPESKVLT